MPTYEYQCLKCGKVFEVFQGIKDKPIKACPDKSCKGKVKRLISAGGGFIFKGPGFYATDYKKSESNVSGHKKEKPDSACQGCEKKEGGCGIAK